MSGLSKKERWTTGGAVARFHLEHVVARQNRNLLSPRDCRSLASRWVQAVLGVALAASETPVALSRNVCRLSVDPAGLRIREWPTEKIMPTRRIFTGVSRFLCAIVVTLCLGCFLIPNGWGETVGGPPVIELEGAWDFRFDAAGAGEAGGWYKTDVAGA